MHATILRMNHEESQERDDQEDPREVNYQFVASQRMIRGMREEVTNHGVMLREIRDALKGSDLAKDGGIVQRIVDLEINNEILNNKMDSVLQDKRDITRLMKWVWISAGAILMAIFTWALNHFWPPINNK